MQAKLTDVDKDTIRQRRQDGDTLQQIADSYGVSRQYVHQVTGDIPRALLHHPLQPEVLRLYQEGKSCVSIAKELAIKCNSVHRMVRKAGINRTPAEAGLLRRKSQEQSRVITELYQQGGSMADVAKNVGLSVNAVAKYIRQAGIARSPSAALTLVGHKKYQHKREQAVDLYRQGYPCTEVATMLGVSCAFVLKYSKAAGLDKHDRKAAAIARKGQNGVDK